MTKNFWVEITQVVNGQEQAFKTFECNTREEVYAIIEQYKESEGYYNYFGSNNGSLCLPEGYTLVDVINAADVA